MLAEPLTLLAPRWVSYYDFNKDERTPGVSRAVNAVGAEFGSYFEFRKD